jgi:hypothetical protein
MGLYTVGVVTSFVNIVCGSASGASIAGSATNQGGVFTELFGVTAPNTGSQVGSIEWTNAVSATFGAITATGVDQVTSLNNGTSAVTAFGLTVSKAVTSNSGDLTVTVLGTGSSDTSGTSNQTRRTIDWGSMDTGPGTANPTHTWTVGSNQSLTISCANFKAAGGGSVAVFGTSLLMMGVGN